MVNSNDVAAGYAGIVFGISNTFATIPGIVSPYLVGVITKNVIDYISYFYSKNIKFYKAYFYLARNYNPNGELCS